MFPSKKPSKIGTIDKFFEVWKFLDIGHNKKEVNFIKESYLNG